MNIHNATIITTLHNVLTDLRLRHIGGDIFIEATTPPIFTKGSRVLGPTFIIYDLERSFAVALSEVLNEATGRPDGVMFSPIILAEIKPNEQYLNSSMRMSHGDYREMSLLTAYWFLRARSEMNKEQVREFLKTTYGELSVVQWGNMLEPMQDMDRFLRVLKVPVPA